jgi:hypothetical protein
MTTSIIATNVLSLASKDNKEKKVKNFWFLDNNGQGMSKGSVVTPLQI